MGVMFSASALSDDDDKPVADDDVALTNDDDMKSGLFDDVPGIAGCCGEYTSSVYPSFFSSSSSSSCSAEGCYGLDDDADGAAAAAVVAGTMTFLHSVCFEQPTVRASGV